MEININKIIEFVIAMTSAYYLIKFEIGVRAYCIEWWRRFKIKRKQNRNARRNRQETQLESMIQDISEMRLVPIQLPWGEKEDFIFAENFRFLYNEEDNLEVRFTNNKNVKENRIAQEFYKEVTDNTQLVFGFHNIEDNRFFPNITLSLFGTTSCQISKIIVA